MPYQLIAQPAIEPVTLAEIKSDLRIDIDMTDTDVLVQGQIAEARTYIEALTRRALITQQWKLVIDSFPGQAMMGVPFGVRYSTPRNAITLEKSPVISVESITYLDMSGVRQTMPNTDYTVEKAGEPCRITPVFGKIWPISLPQIGAVEVNFTAGYGATVDNIPAVFKSAIRLHVQAHYDPAFDMRGNTEYERKMAAIENLVSRYKVEA